MILLLSLLLNFSLAENPCKEFSPNIVDRCGENRTVTLRYFNNSHFPKDMRGAIFSKSNFNRHKVSDVDFSYNDNVQLQVSNSSFINCKFDHSNFVGSYIKKTNYDNSSFKNVNFKGAKIENASFRNVDFRGANFDSAVFMFVDLRGANLEGVDLSRTTMISVKRD